MKINLVSEICEACWLNQSDLADYTGIKLQRIKDISSGRVAGFKSDDIALLVEKLHLNADWLISRSGDIFKEGYDRRFPMGSVFVSDLVDRLVKLIEPDFYNPVFDDVLGLPSGTVASWVKDVKVPYWYLKKVAHEHAVTIDFLVYGHGENTPYETHEVVNRNVRQETIAYSHLSERERLLLENFNLLSDDQKDMVEAMVNVASQKMKKKRRITF